MYSDAYLRPAPPGVSRRGPQAPGPSGLPPGGVAVAFAADADAPTRARHAAAAVLGHCAPERRDAILLVISELVTNAVRHGSAETTDRVALHLRDRDGTLRVEVVDGRVLGGVVAEAPPRDHAADEQRSGWGLSIVAQLTDRWGVERGPARTCVWCEIDTR